MAMIVPLLLFVRAMMNPPNIPKPSLLPSLSSYSPITFFISYVYIYKIHSIVYILLLIEVVGSGFWAPFKGDSFAPDTCGDNPQAPMVTNSSAAVG